MSDSKPIGSISWTDLTVPNAEEIRKFYQAVVGWQTKSLDMGGYKDFCMIEPASGKTVAGVCHARGENAELPAQWMIYITVANVDASVERCVKMGGSLLSGPREMGGQGRVAIIKDPAGAVVALFQPTTS